MNFWLDSFVPAAQKYKNNSQTFLEKVSFIGLRNGEMEILTR